MCSAFSNWHPTAPIFLSEFDRKKPTHLEIAGSVKKVSGFNRSINDPVAFLIPILFALLKPIFSWRRMKEIQGYAEHNSAERSFPEKLSTMIISLLRSFSKVSME